MARMAVVRWMLAVHGGSTSDVRLVRCVRVRVLCCEFAFATTVGGGRVHVLLTRMLRDELLVWVRTRHHAWRRGRRGTDARMSRVTAWAMAVAVRWGHVHVGYVRRWIDRIDLFKR